MAIYGYCRISRSNQNLERQVRNILQFEPSAIIIREIFTGRVVQARPQWQKLCDKLKPNDTVIFDSVSRMSRDADEGIATYMELYDRGINLIFIKEMHISTSTYREALESRKLNRIGDETDILLQAIEEYLKALAKKQILLSFMQSQKEVDDLRQRTREGIQTARLSGRQVGGVKGRKLHTKKSDIQKPLIIKYARDFNGTLTDADTIKLLGISRNTYFRYKKQIREELEQAEPTPD